MNGKDRKFAALAEPKRLRMVEIILKSGGMASTKISNKFDGISASAVSQHLKVLKDADLVEPETKAQQRIYRINLKGFHEIEGWINKMTQKSRAGK